MVLLRRCVVWCGMIRIRQPLINLGKQKLDCNFCYSSWRGTSKLALKQSHKRNHKENDNNDKQFIVPTLLIPSLKRLKTKTHGLSVALFYNSGGACTRIIHFSMSIAIAFQHSCHPNARVSGRYVIDRVGMAHDITVLFLTHKSVHYIGLTLHYYTTILFLSWLKSCRLVSDVQVAPYVSPLLPPPSPAHAKTQAESPQKGKLINTST